MMQTEETTSAHSSDTAHSEQSTDPLETALGALHSLQLKHSHMSASVASSLGIAATDLRALLFIASADGVTPKQTGQFMQLSSGAITNLVDRLVAAGFVTREPNPKDRRSLMVHISPAGVAAVDKVGRLYRRSLVGSVPREHLESLAAAFDAIGDSLTQSAEEEFDTER